MFGSQKTEFFGAPEAEADGVLCGVLGELNSGLEDSNGAGAIVVDSGACKYGIGVSTDSEDLVLVAALGVGDDVVSTNWLVKYFGQLRQVRPT